MEIDFVELVSRMLDKAYDTRIEPKYLYIGREELADLRIYVYKKYYRTFDISDRPEFMGLKVIEVNLNSHFEIGR